jgi:hypothetical protein
MRIEIHTGPGDIPSPAALAFLFKILIGPDVFRLPGGDMLGLVKISSGIFGNRVAVIGRPTSTSAGGVASLLESLSGLVRRYTPAKVAPQP